MSLLRRAAPILSLLAAASPLAAQTPDPLSAAKHVSERYELYAPTQQDVDRARPHVERALEGFARAFGAPAPRVAVVLFDTNPALAGFDDAPLARRGLATRRWLTERAASGRSPDLVGATQLGVVLGAAREGGGVRVAAAIPGSAAVGLQPGDVIRSLNGTAAATLDELGGLFDALPVGAQVTLEVDRGGARTPLAFAKPAGPALRRGASGQAAREPRGPGAPATGGWGATLAHETAHTLLDAYVRARLGREARVPSWLHEAVAQYVELPTAEARAPRLETARQLLGSHTPLAELFTMEHPMAAMLRAAQGAAPGAGSAPRTGLTSIAISSGPGGRQASAGFYPQALSVLEFLLARAGGEILPRLAGGLASGKTVAQVLAESKAPLPAEPAALEREWAAWVSAPAPR